MAVGIRFWCIVASLFTFDAGRPVGVHCDEDSNDECFWLTIDKETRGLLATFFSNIAVRKIAEDGSQNSRYKSTEQPERRFCNWKQSATLCHCCRGKVSTERDKKYKTCFILIQRQFCCFDPECICVYLLFTYVVKSILHKQKMSWIFPSCCWAPYTEEMLSHRFGACIQAPSRAHSSCFIILPVAVAATAYFVVSCAALRFEMLFVSSSASLVGVVVVSVGKIKCNSNSQQ